MPPEAPQPNSLPDADRWPKRLHYAVAGGFFLALAIYGSLVPLEYRALDWSTAVKKFAQLFTHAQSRLSRTDVAVNVLLFVPVSFCLLAAFTPTPASRFSLLWRAAVVFVGCTLSSLLIEFSQLWYLRRTSSAYDVGAQIIGTLIGIGSWILVGKSFTAWLRTRSPGHARLVSLASLLAAYYAGLLLYWMLPLDLSIHPQELFHKHRDGRLSLHPFAEINSVAAALELITHVAAFVPVGMLAVVLFTSDRRPLRSWLGSLVLAMFLVALVWSGGVIAISRYSSSTQLLAGCCGAGLGIGFARWWLGKLFTSPAKPGEAPADQERFWPLLFLAIAYSGLLVVLFCYPAGEDQRPIIDGQQLQQRFNSMFRPPLSSLYHGSIFNAAKELVRKIGFFFPLGLLLALSVTGLKVPTGVGRVLLAGAWLWGALLGLSLELIQVVIPGHTPDLTDVALYTIGSTLGVGLVWLWSSDSSNRPAAPK